MKRRAGFTLVEILIAVAILALLVAVVVPSFAIETRQRLNAAAMILSSDIDYAQVMTLSNPQEPHIVRFDADGRRYWIARADAPNTPVARPDTGEPYLMVFGEDRASSAAGIRFELADTADRTLEFEPHGGLADFTSAPVIVLTEGSNAYPRVRITLASTTGSLAVMYEPRAP